ncbi:phosphatase PAP2 family protein [Geomonas sp. Red276]
MLKVRATAAVLLVAATITVTAHAEPLDSSQQVVQVETGGIQPAPVTTYEIATTDDSPRPVDKFDFGYLKGAFADTGKVLISPIHWDGKDWLKFGAVAGATAGFFLLDGNIKNFAQSHKSNTANGFATVGNDLGNGLYTLPALGAFYAYGAMGNDHKARRASLLALESYAISGLITEGLKTTFQRHRPNTGQDPDSFNGPHFSLKNVSFSSGHTASAFSIATIFANVYKDNPFVPPLAYGLASLTGLSRIYSNEHWSSDVFVGAALGYFTSKALLKFHPDDRDTSLSKRLMILPQVGKEMTGLTVKYDF